ncbi:MAG: transcriptional regulator, LysR family, partial [Xanthomonadaceae bacterium]|nr:transcriptional regulator, LysR family [Xanthomonadaceae bacterium]
EQGVGITLLPETLCAQQVRDGTLEVVLPQWRLPQGIFHAVFASRRGLLPAVRVFIDFLVEKMPALLDAARLDCQDCPDRAVTSSAARSVAAEDAV